MPGFPTGYRAMSAGLGNSVLAGQSSAGRTQAVIDYHLDRLFPASRPALRRAPIRLWSLPSPQWIARDIVKDSTGAPDRGPGPGQAAGERHKLTAGRSLRPGGS